MKKHLQILLLVFIVLSGSFTASAQSWQWAIGSNCPKGFIESSPVVTDSKGNIYEAVTVAIPVPMSSISHDSLKTYFGSDTITGSGTMVIKIDSNGNYKWVLKSKGGVVTKLVVGPGDSLYIFGFYGADLHLDTVSLPDLSQAATFCGCITPSGSVLWLRHLADSSYNCAGGLDNAGNLYVAGDFRGSSVSFGSTTLHNSSYGLRQDIYFVKYDRAGNVIWARRYGNDSADFVSQAATTPDGHTFISGFYNSKRLVFGPDTVTNYQHSVYYYVAGFDSSGNALWADSIASNKNMDAMDIEQDNLGNAYIVGSYSGIISFGADSSLYPVYSNKMYLAKYNKYSGFKWARSTYTLAQGWGVAADICGNVWASSHDVMHGMDASEIDQWDSSGTFITTITVPVGGEDPSGIAADNKGNLYFAGDYSASFVLAGDTVLLKDSTTEALFLAKYSYTFCSVIDTNIGPSDSTLAATNLLNTQTGPVKLIPNPATSDCTLRVENGMGQLTGFVLTDCVGRIVINSPASGNSHRFSVNQLKPGIYICRITLSDNTTTTQKLVVTR